MSWNELTPEQMAEASLYYQEDAEHAYLHALCETLGIKDYQTLQRHIRNYLQYAEVFLGTKAYATNKNDLARNPVPPAPEPVGFNSPRPTDITHVDPNTDQGAWVDWLYTQYQEANDLRVMHACDIHFPFHDNGALEMFYKVYEKTQPSVCVVGSDAFDFNAITSFIKDPDVKEFDEDGDIIDSVAEYWNPFVNRLKDLSPNTKLVFVWGNHEHRLIRDLIANAAQYRKRILRDFADMVRCGDGVWWVGETDYVRMGPLIVQHGQRHGVNASKNTLKDTGWQLSTMQGHNHTPGIFEMSGDDYVVRSVNSGCLCLLDPHYVRGKKTRGTWQHGTVIGMMNMRERDVEFMRPHFRSEPVEGGLKLWTRLGFDKIEIRVPHK